MRPATAVTEENIVAVEKLVRENNRVTFKDIEGSLQIGSPPAVSKILHEYLRVRKVASRWVPYTLTESQKRIHVEWCEEMLKRFERGNSRRVSDIVTGDETWIYQFDPENKRQSTVWIFPDEHPPTKVKRPRSVGKKMVATFFSKSGHVTTLPLEEQRTVTALWYTTICLPKVFAKLQERRMKTRLRRIILHHDNASAHAANLTIQFLESTEVKLMTHPPYSSDLAPCDYFRFPTVKRRRRGRILKP